MHRELEQRLIHGAAELGVVLDAAAVELLGRYLALLVKWNRRINLTSIRDERGIVDKHFLDSLAVVPHVPAEAKTLLDAGTGPGFPGAVIAAVRPDLAVTLLESHQKKVAFLETLRRELALPNVTVAGERLEKASLPRFDVVVSRATWDLPIWLNLAASLVRPGGLVIGMEGAEEHPLPPGAQRVRYRLAGATRAVILWHPS